MSLKTKQTDQLEILDAVLVVDLLLSDVRLQAVHVSAQLELRLGLPVLDQGGRGDGVHLQLGDGVVVFGQDVLQLLLVHLDAETIEGRDQK